MGSTHVLETGVFRQGLIRRCCGNKRGRRAGGRGGGGAGGRGGGVGGRDATNEIRHSMAAGRSELDDWC